MEPVRIQKWLSMMGLASRRQAEAWLKDRKISVNGTVVTELGLKITPGKDEIFVDGKSIGNKLPPRVYWLLNKPNQVVTSRVGDGLRTIYDLPALSHLPFLVSPAGRLDFQTEGLLLITNDGELANRLTHPKFEVPRFYRVQVRGRLSEKDEERVAKREISFEDGPCPKIVLSFLENKNLNSKNSWYDVTVYEGRNRLVRRLFEALDFEVKRLVRYGFGPMRLPENLATGEYCELKPAEITALKKLVGLL